MAKTAVPSRVKSWGRERKPLTQAKKAVHSRLQKDNTKQDRSDGNSGNGNDVRFVKQWESDPKIQERAGTERSDCGELEWIDLGSDQQPGLETRPYKYRR